MTNEIKEMLRDAATAVDLILLIRIWLDGRAIRALEKMTNDLHLKYFAERQAERAAKLAQLAKAREAKAAKKTEAPTP